MQMLSLIWKYQSTVTKKKTLSTNCISNISKAPKRERFENTGGNSFYRSRDFLKINK